MLKPLVPKFCIDLSARLKGIAETQVPAKLKPIVSKGQVAKGLMIYWIYLELATARSQPQRNRVKKASLRQRHKILYFWS